MKNFVDFLFESISSDSMETLGLTGTFSADELKKAYRVASSKNHPDKGGTTVSMQKVNAAYDYLQKHGGTGVTLDKTNRDTEVREKINAYVEYLESSINKYYSQEKFQKFLEKNLGEHVGVAMQITKTTNSYYNHYSYLNLTIKAENDDKSISLTAVLSFNAYDVISASAGLSSGSESSFAGTVSVVTEFFANNRKQNIVRGNFSFKRGSFSFLTDPDELFPSAKLVKGRKNTSTKFTRKDMFLGLEKKLGAQIEGDDVYIPIGDGKLLNMYRSVFMKQAAWEFGDIFIKNERGFLKRETKYSGHFSAPETEKLLEALVAILKNFKGNDYLAMVKKVLEMSVK